MRKSPSEVVETDVVIFPMNIDEGCENDSSNTSKKPKSENINSGIVEKSSRLLVRESIKRF